MSLKFADGVKSRYRKMIKRQARGWAKSFKVKADVIEYHGLKLLVYKCKGWDPPYYVQPLPTKTTMKVYRKGANNDAYSKWLGRYCSNFVQGCTKCEEKFTKLLGGKARAATALLVLKKEGSPNWCPFHGQLANRDKHGGLKPLFE